MPLNPYELEQPALLAYIEALFGDNSQEEITPEDARDGFKALIYSSVLKHGGALSVNQLRGGMHIKPTLAALAAIPASLRVVGMSCLVANPAGPTELAAGVVLDPVTFVLVKDSGGEYEACIDADSSAVTQATWVLSSGSEEDKIASYPLFAGEDHPYKKDDPVQFTHAGGAVRLYRARKDLTSYVNPEPTGDDNDANWVAFAPLSGNTLTVTEAVSAVLDQLGRGLKQFVVGTSQAVRKGEWWVCETGIFEARRAMNASALPEAGLNWSLVFAGGGGGAVGLTAQAFVDLIHPESTIHFDVIDERILPSLSADSVRFDHLEAELQGAFQLATSARCIVTTQAGARIPYASAITAAAQLLLGETLEVYGHHDYTGQNLPMVDNSTLVLTPGAYMKAREVYGPNNGRFTVLGPGTLEALISPGPRTYQTLVQQLHLVGRLNPFAYNQDYNAVRLVRVTDCTIEAGNSPALTCQYGHGGYYRSLVRCEFDRNRISTSAAAVFQLYDSLLGNAADPAAEAGNALQLINNIISAPAATADKVVDATQGVFTYEQANNTYLGTAAPTKSGSPTVVVFPGGSAGTAPKPSPPVLVTQDDELNRMEWTKESALTPGGYEVSMDAGDSAATITSAQVTDGKIRISVPSGHVGVGIIGLRKRATASAPASDWTFNTIPFTPVELFQNASFDNGSANWVHGGEVSFNGGQAVFAGDSIGGQNNLGQAPQSQTVGKLYRIRAYGSLISGTPRMLTDSGANGSGQNFPPFVDGYTEVIITLASVDAFFINGGGCVGLKLDKFSFTEV